MNAGSITGAFGKQVKKVAFELLDHRCVHFIASDCHHESSRPMILSRARKVVEKNWGPELAENLFEINPRCAVSGEPLSQKDALPLAETKSKRKKFFSRKF